MSIEKFGLGSNVVRVDENGLSVKPKISRESYLMLFGPPFCAIALAFSMVCCWELPPKKFDFNLLLGTFCFGLASILWLFFTVHTLFEMRRGLFVSRSGVQIKVRLNQSTYGTNAIFCLTRDHEFTVDESRPWAIFVSDRDGFAVLFLGEDIDAEQIDKVASQLRALNFQVLSAEEYQSQTHDRLVVA